MGDLFGIALEWLSGSIDPSRPHVITQAQSWHGRFMMLAWGICIPLGIVVARYLKVTPNQNWPEELDNKFWWHAHLLFQIGGTVLMFLALGIILTTARSLGWHGVIGWTIIVLASAQLISGFLRGSKGGPTDLSDDGTLRGDHYDLTERRVLFEVFHKTVGYLLLLGGAFGALHGLWTANAPVWIFLSLVSFWGLLGCGVVIMSKRCLVRKTYHAIWGPDPKLPGNRKS